MAEENVARELLAVFGFGVDTHELKDGENRVEAFLGKVKTLAAGFAGAFLGKEIYEFTERSVNAMSDLASQAQRLALTTDRFQELRYAADQASVPVEEFTSAMNKLQISQQKASEGAKSQSEAFAKFGVSTKKANGEMKSSDELMLDLADAMEKIQDPGKRASLAADILGKTAGPKMVALLSKGREGIEKLAREYQELGGWTEDTIKMAEDNEKQNKKLAQSWVGMKNIIVSVLLPPMTKITQVVASAVKWFRTLAKDTPIVQAALGVLAAAAAGFAVAMAVANAPILLMAAALAFLVLAVEDIISTFQGKDTILRDIIDGLFGKGTTTDVVENLKESWKGVSKFLGEAWEHLKLFLDGLDDLKEKLQYVPVFKIAQTAFELSKQANFRKVAEADRARLASRPSAGSPLLTERERLQPAPVVETFNVTQHITQKEGENGERFAKRAVSEMKNSKNKTAARTLERSTAVGK